MTTKTPPKVGADPAFKQAQQALIDSVKIKKTPVKQPAAKRNSTARKRSAG